MSALYPAAKEQFLQGGINMATADIRAVLIDTADEVYNAADVFLSDVTAAGIVGTAVSLAGKTFTGGVFDATDTTFTGVTGDTVEAILLYVHTGVSTTARLIAFLDGVTLTPNGGNAVATWDNTASRIFAI